MMRLNVVQTKKLKSISKFSAVSRSINKNKKITRQMEKHKISLRSYGLGMILVLFFLRLVFFVNCIRNHTIMTTSNDKKFLDLYNFNTQNLQN